MLKWLIVLLITTIIAGIFAFTGIVSAIEIIRIARIVFTVLLVVFIICIFIYTSNCDETS